MTLADGKRLEHYEIVGPLGAGGMGEVYRAVDTKLRREVAIKILPTQFASDPSRLARFEREAHVLASLNHPNIAAIYGLEHVDGIRFLVLELVEGPTLADRMKSGPMEVSEALNIAGQIAEALEAAHEKGVVHRDLKPANVKVTPTGKVKVLDFGLAKALGDAEPASPALNTEAQSTATIQETRAGIVLGTAAYISPEQAEGKPTDKRSDVWSFGVVLYEMLSGKRCFDGKSVSHVIVHVLEQEPDWVQLPGAVPGGVRQLLERCLQKDAAHRLRDIGDLRLQLQALEKETATASRTTRAPAAAPVERRSLLWPTVAAALVLAAVVGAFLYFRPKPAPAEALRFDIAAPEKVALSSAFAVSPDGHQLAFIAAGEDRVRHLWIRSLETGQARALDATNDADGTPIWSPDSRSVVFSVGQGTYRLMKMEASGSPPQMIADIGAPSAVQGGFWTSDNKIVFAQIRVGVREVSAAGGDIATLVTSRGPFQGFPTLLPDGRHFLYVGVFGASTAAGGVFVGSLDDKPEQPGSKKLLPDPSSIAYVPNPASGLSGADQGYLLFVRSVASSPAGTLMAQSFDSRKLELTGDPTPVAERVGNFSVSSGGVLVYRTAEPGQARPDGPPPTWFDRQGKSLGPAGEPGTYSAIALSPDEKRVATSRVVGSANNDIWLYEFAHGVPTRFTFGQGLNSNPVWSPDGSRIVFSSGRTGPWDLYVKASNGVGEDQLLLKTPDNKTPTSWSRDGRFLLYNLRNGGDLFVLPMSDGVAATDRKPFLFAPKASAGRFSPDMRWIAYVSPETGGNEAWVRPFDPTSATGAPASGGKWMVSKGGATSIRWRGDGKELFYVAPDGTIMSVAVTTSPSSPAFGADVPKPLFKGSPLLGIYWDVSQDGKRFLLDSAVVRSVPDAKAPVVSVPYKVILNWTAALKR